MSERLGEYLVKAGKITEKQLALVLERQVTMGGRLGTNLIEMGFLTESELTQFLSKKLEIPFVQGEDLDHIDPSLIHLVPREIAQKYNTIPIKRDRNTLSVALEDPTDLEALDELRFITGCVIKPFIASEARIQYALERFYQVSRQLRYVAILDEERKKHAAETGDSEKMAKTEPSAEELEAAMHQAKEDLVEVRGRDEAIAVFLRTANVVLDRGILFLLKAELISAWKAFPAYREQEVAGLEFKLHELPLFKDVITARTFYHGQTPDGPVIERLLKALGGGAPAEILLLPILIGEQVVAVLYGDNQLSGLPIKHLEFIRKLGRKVAMALEILILRKKILEL